MLWFVDLFATTRVLQQTEITNLNFDVPLAYNASTNLYRQPPTDKLFVNDHFEWAMGADTSPGAIGPWLESLGLGRYRQIFIAEEIDLQILPDLTEAELSSLGIPLGPRKKIVNAARALRGAAASRNGGGNGAGRVDPETSSSPIRGAERRHLTVLTCDMVNSTV